jgi:hypothetical protein
MEIDGSRVLLAAPVGAVSGFVAGFLASVVGLLARIPRNRRLQRAGEPLPKDQVRLRLERAGAPLGLLVGPLLACFVPLPWVAASLLFGFPALYMVLHVGVSVYDRLSSDS